jgi:hypothetical protein
MHTATVCNNSFSVALPSCATARHPFIKGVRRRFVEFDHHGWRQELVRDRIAPDDVVWASDLLGRSSDRQWACALRAGGYTSDAAMPSIRTLRARIGEGRRLPAGARPTHKGD